MNTQPILSILTPTIPARAAQLARLSDWIRVQVDRNSAAGQVEHRALDDVPGQRRLTVGEKRDRLIREARGKYVAFVDDDDWIDEDYLSEILEAARQDPDVITFCQQAQVDGQLSRVEFRLGNPNERFNPGGTTRRNAWHICAWRRDLAILSQFPATNYGEDWAWAAPLCALPDLREVHVPISLHHYIHSAATTAAPPPR